MVLLIFSFSGKMKYKTTIDISADKHILKTPHFSYLARLKYDYEICHH